MPLLRWVLAWWRSDRLAPVSSTGQALAVDPPSKKDDSVAISVLCRGCAIPVAWRILRAKRVLDGPDSGTAPSTGPGGAQGNDRGGAVRPGLGQSEIVEPDTRSEPAPGHDRGAVKSRGWKWDKTRRTDPARTVSVIRHGIDWLRRLLLKGRLWSRVWLLPEPWLEPKSNLEVTRLAPPHTYPCQGLTGGYIV